MDDIQTAPIQELPAAPRSSFLLSPTRLTIALLSIVLILIVVGAGFFLFSRKANAATIAGIINYTALKPDPTDQGTVYVKYRPYGSTGAYTTVYASALADKSPWKWDGAASGKVYDMQAQLVVDGKVVAMSEPHIVTAPAIDESLNLHVTWKDLPQSVLQSQTTYVSGTANIEGVVPTGAMLEIQSENPQTKSFSTEVALANPQLSNSWKWDKVTPLQDYTLRAVLMLGSKVLGTSETLSVSGGDNQISFTVISSASASGGATPVQPTSSPNVPTQTIATATPIPSNGSITGSVDINGPLNANTSLLMLWRTPGSSTYQQITRITYPSNNGQAWSWTGLQPGQQYEVTAVLQVNNNNTATTQSQIVTVPASNVNFVLNSGVFIPTPSSPVNVISCNGVGGNQYSATISFSQQQNAGNYWIQVGTNPAWSDIYNNKITATNSNPQITFQVNSGQSYFAQYAYSLCQNCSSNVNFSNFSQSLPFSCGGGSTYTGYACNTNPYACTLTTQNNPPYPLNNGGLQQCQQQCIPPTPTMTPIPTNTPVPVPTNTPIPPSPTPTPLTSSCNQSCGGNGYVCASGLSCTSTGGGIGSDVCRNPSCPTEPNCQCP